MHPAVGERRADATVVQRSLQECLAQILTLLVEILFPAVLLKAESIFAVAAALEICRQNIAYAVRHGVADDVTFLVDCFARVAGLDAEEVDGPSIHV